MIDNNYVTVNFGWLFGPLPNKRVFRQGRGIYTQTQISHVLPSSQVFISEHSETETQQPLTAPCECSHVISVTRGEINDL